jgi:hypothetical protein
MSLSRGSELGRVMSAFRGEADIRNLSRDVC